MKTSQLAGGIGLWLALMVFNLFRKETVVETLATYLLAVFSAPGCHPVEVGEAKAEAQLFMFRRR